MTLQVKRTTSDGRAVSIGTFTSLSRTRVVNFLVRGSDGQTVIGIETQWSLGVDNRWIVQILDVVDQCRRAFSFHSSKASFIIFTLQISFSKMWAARWISLTSLAVSSCE